jgi:hypothetical protein
MDLKIFIAITVAAVVVQAGMLVSIFVAFRKTVNTIRVLAELRQQIFPIVQIARSIACDFGPKLETLTANVSEVRTLVRSRIEHFEAARNGTEGRIRFQLTRGSGLVTKTTDRFEDVNKNIRRTLVIPIRKLSKLFRILTFAVRLLKGN